TGSTITDAQTIKDALQDLETAVESGGGGAFSTTSNVTSNVDGDILNDDFVFGSNQLDENTGTGDDDSRMFFDKDQAAFRAGIAGGDNWDEVNVGGFSVAMGYQTTASGISSTAFGFDNVASGNYSYAIGSGTSASGNISFSAGNGTKSEANLSFALGRYNTGGGSAAGWVATDPLFEVGNGVSDVNRSNALTLLKNGNLEIAGTLKVGDDYTLPATDGGSNQILKTDGSGTLSWADAGGGGAFSTTSNVTSNAGGDIATDDFVFGSDQLDDKTGTDDNTRMFFDKNKAAFRAGRAQSTQWDEANIGNYSVGFGWSPRATGSSSMAVGDGVESSGDGSFATGQYTTASGTYSAALGKNTTAQAYGLMVIGRYNEISGSTNSWNATDPLFVAGNGADALNPSNALTLLKNGNLEIAGTLKVGDTYTLPATDGGSNQILQTDGSGTLSWADAGGGGAFSTTSNVTSNAGGDMATDDFVFGSDQLDDDSGTADDNRRMFFDKLKGAFRVGHSDGGEWDAASVGNNSVAMGDDNTASGLSSFAMGEENTASGSYSFAVGSLNNSTETNTAAFGVLTTASGRTSVAMGYGTT
ncbi:MAG: hypothetical protein MI892_18270, partial [Desulfobacterales bacterium]|nr:hypothetical protein [Desulfobacterales bacterium]